MLNAEIMHFRVPTSAAGITVFKGILFNGKCLYEEIVLYPTPPYPGLEALFTPGQLYNGPRFGAERWAFWQERFYEASEWRPDIDIEALSGGTGPVFGPIIEACDLARRAAEFMEALARTVKW
ncbi:hypothetical protein BJX70DRAFT_399447 [Aspergillus crustosus]